MADITSTFDFPLDLYPKSYSGMGPEFKGMLTDLLPMMKTTFEQFPGQQKQFYDQSRSDINTGFNEAMSNVGKSYERNLQPALQTQLNSLANRGMLNSSVAGETLGNTAKGIGEGIQDKLAALNLGKQTALSGIAQNQGQSLYQLPQLLTSLLGQGQYSESTNEGAPYATALGFLQSMMG
jgi:hypothetical protein